MNFQTRQKLLSQLKRHEQSGIVSLIPYKCSRNKLTIGWGHNYQDNPLLPEIKAYLRAHGNITPEMANLQLSHDVDCAIEQAQNLIPVFNSLDPVRQAVIVNMIFNLGSGFITFGRYYWPNFNQSLNQLNFPLTAHNMKDTIWYNEVGDRAVELTHMMLTGEWRKA